ncbi:MAG TPA: triose-phosphate isomerase, partial [Brevundimonas sp.]|nr:triose-phosphate isomerase [Brevundimonas sp.]
MQQSMKLVAGNWKMNGLAAGLTEVATLRAALTDAPANCRVALCPPATLIERMARAA